MNIQWFPGHMAKTRKLLQENLKIVDVVIELLDSRIPKSSKNPEFDKILKSKHRILALNKSDLADENTLNLWKNYYKESGFESVFLDSLRGKGFGKLKTLLRNSMKEKIEKAKSKGRKYSTIKTMVVGIPNVGKSLLINKIAGRSSAKTGNKPGVTKGKQWIRLNNEIQLLDTPGVLWPKFNDMETALNLAYTGAIKDEVLDTVEVATSLMMKLKEMYPQNIMQRYKLDSLDCENGFDLLKITGRKRGCIVSGGEIDLYRISNIILNEFRSGIIGRITLENPDKNI